MENANSVVQWPVKLLVGFAFVCAALLVLPGHTITTRYLPDLMLILDGAYRVVSGLTPHRDFHTPLGPLTAYIPALAYSLTGSYGTAMPVGMALVILILLPPIVVVISSRLEPSLAALYGTFLIVILAVPINLGESVTSLSFAKFYNRVGWVALGTLLVMYLKPRLLRAGQDSRDAVVAAFLTLVMVYTKATFGAVALAFLTFMIFNRDQRRWALRAVALCAATALVIELVWRSHGSYVGSLGSTLEVSGLLRGSWGQILDHLLVNMADYVLFGLLVTLATRCTHGLRDGLFFLSCATLGFLLVNQNFQTWGILTLHAAGVVAAEIVLRSTQGVEKPAAHSWSKPAGAQLVLAAMVLPPIVHCSLGLGLHAGAAMTSAGLALSLERMDRVRLAKFSPTEDHRSSEAYLVALQSGLDLLKGHTRPHEPVRALDVVNPFPLLASRQPTNGETPWLHWGRTVDASNGPKTETLLSDAVIIIEPKPQPGSEAARAFATGQHPAVRYAAALGPHFEVVAETEHWRLHRRLKMPRQTSCTHPCTAPEGSHP